MTTLKGLTDRIAECHADRGTAVVDLHGVRFVAWCRRSCSIRVECTVLGSEPVFVGVFGTPAEAAAAVLEARETL